MSSSVGFGYASSDDSGCSYSSVSAIAGSSLTLAAAASTDQHPHHASDFSSNAEVLSEDTQVSSGDTQVVLQIASCLSLGQFTMAVDFHQLKEIAPDLTVTLDSGSDEQQRVVDLDEFLSACKVG